MTVPRATAEWSSADCAAWRQRRRKTRLSDDRVLSPVIASSAPFQPVFRLLARRWTFVTDASLLAWTRNNCRVQPWHKGVDSF
jgi:hypothetical protein